MTIRFSLEQLPGMPYLAKTCLLVSLDEELASPEQQAIHEWLFENQDDQRCSDISDEEEATSMAEKSIEDVRQATRSPPSNR